MSDSARSLNAAAPAPLRLLLDAIERLGRLDGWIGAACLVTLTLLMLAEITVRALSNIFPWVPADIPVAIESPKLDGQSIWRYGLIGVYVGVRPLWTHNSILTGARWLDMAFAAVFMLRGALNVRTALSRRRATLDQP